MKKGLVLFFCFLLCGSAFSQKKSGTKGDSPILSERQQLNNTALFLDAVKERLNENYDISEEMLNKVLAVEPQHDAACYELAIINVLKGNFGDAISLAERANGINPDNQWYIVMLGDLYARVNQYNSAASCWKILSERYADNPDYLNNYAYSLVQMGLIKKAVVQYDKLEELIGVNEKLSETKKLMYLQINKVEKAAGEIKILSELFPSEPKYLVEIAQIYISNGKESKAIAYLEKAQILDSTNDLVQSTLYDYYLRKKKDKEALEMLENIFSNSRVSIAPKKEMILRYYGMSVKNPKYYEEAYRLLDLMQKAHPDSVSPLLLRTDFLLSQNKYSEAVIVLERALSMDSTYFQVWKTYMQLLVTLEKYDRAYFESEKFKELFPMHPEPYFFHALSATVKKNWEEVVSDMNIAKKYIYDNKPMLADIAYFLGLAYHNLGRNSESDESFEDAIRLKSEDPKLYNDYAYFLYERGERIQYALKLSEKAVKMQPNNPYYEDTYACLLMSVKDTGEAKIWFERAINHGGDMVYSILEHYADFLESKGDLKSSDEYRKKANLLRALEPETE